MSGKKALARNIEKAASRNTTEHVVNAFKAALATVPFCGGIATLMTDYIPTMKQRRIDEFVERVADDLIALRDRVDDQALQTDEFAFIFEKCFRGVAENYQAEKLDAFRGILVNAAIGEDVAGDEQEYFLNLVNTLSALHLRILSFMAAPHNYLNARDISPEQISGGFSSFFPVAIPGIDIEVIKSAFGDLHQAGLINTDKTIFSAMTSSGGLDLLGDGVSKLGRRFVTFCTSPA